MRGEEPATGENFWIETQPDGQPAILVGHAAPACRQISAIEEMQGACRGVGDLAQVECRFAQGNFGPGKNLWRARQRALEFGLTHYGHRGEVDAMMRRHCEGRMQLE